MINTFEIAKLIQTTCPKAYAKIMGEVLRVSFLLILFVKDVLSLWKYVV